MGGQQDRTLTFARVSNALGHAAVVWCKGENGFGESVAKAFQVHVSEAETSAVNVTTLSALTSAFGILLVLSLGYLYWKYRKFGSALGAILTREEVREFHEGSPAPAPEGAATLFEYVGAQELMQYGEDRELEMTAIECMPYNSEFEVRKENLVVGMATNSQFQSDLQCDQKLKIAEHVFCPFRVQYRAGFRAVRSHLQGKAQA